MSLEHILLGMLRDPASGYDLRKAFDSGPRHFWSAELGQIYPALQTMEERGWLRSRRQQSPRGPDRRVYERTPKGASALRAWLLAEPVIGNERLAYIGQLIFMGELDDLSQSRRFLDHLRQRLTSTTEFLRSAEAALLPAAESVARLDDDQFHELLCLRIGIHGLQGKIAACDEGMKLIHARHSRRRRNKERSRG